MTVTKMAVVALLLTLPVLPQRARNVLPMGAHCNLLMAATALPQLPEPGNPGHREPPPGEACQHGGDPAHNCACHRECVPDEDEDGHQTVRVQEDPKCRAFCFKDHCHCPVRGCD